MEADITFRQVTWNKCKLAINIIVLIVLFLVVLYICYIPYMYYHYLFTWHVVFGAIAFLFLIPISLLIFDNAWLMKYTKKEKCLVHGILTSIATGVTIISIYCEYYRKEMYKENYQIIHFRTPHAMIGLLSLLVLLIGNLSGLSAQNIKWFFERNIIVRPVILKLCHNFFGQISYISGIISICIVIHNAWFISHTTAAVTIIITVLIASVTLWTLLKSFFNGVYQINNIINE